MICPHHPAKAGFWPSTSPVHATSSCRRVTSRTSRRRHPSPPPCWISCCPERKIMDESERYASGLEVRRAVLGNAHVDRSLANLNPFNEEFQDLITRYAWGSIWTRPGLPRHTRSLLTLVMMIALNRGDEFRLHVRAAFNNGVTRDEIKEVILECAIYDGVPAAHCGPRL